MSDLIHLGKTPDGTPVDISLLRLIDSRALIQASSGGGKSYSAGQSTWSNATPKRHARCHIVSLCPSSISDEFPS